jgi:hypothetical protein
MSNLGSASASALATVDKLEEVYQLTLEHVAPRYPFAYGTNMQQRLADLRVRLAPLSISATELAELRSALSETKEK